jgi:hypothetical protein
MKLFLVAGSCLLIAVLCASPADATHASSDLAGTGGPLPSMEQMTPPGSSRAQARSEESARATGLARAAARQASMAMLGVTTREDRAGRVNPGIAFLMSAVLPGSGQIAEGRNRAFAYLGVEALAWIAHFSWLDAGNKKEGEYESYARHHWALDKWDFYAADSACALPPGVSYADSKETIEGFLEAQNYQHYYEDIGKLEAFRAGWDDFDCAQPNSMSANRRHYRGMREDSNNYLDSARNALTVIFLNHVISAVDAYRTAKGAHLSLPGGAEMKFRVAGSPRNPSVGLRVTRAW